MTGSGSSFHEFELEGWGKESVTVAYHDQIAPVTRQAVNALLDAASVKSGMGILDVATGAGYVAAAAVQRGAAAVGIDFSSTQIALARKTHPGIRFEMGDAQNLPFAQASFEAVVSNFGMPHFPDPDAFLREAFRVLRSGGRLAVSTWASPQEATGFGIALAAVQAHGSLDVALPPGPNIFLFADPDHCERSLRAAGFQFHEFRTVPQTWHLSSPDGLYQAFLSGSVRMSALLRAQAPEAAEAIRSAMRASLSRFETNGGLELPMAAVITAGSKP